MLTTKTKSQPISRIMLATKPKPQPVSREEKIRIGASLPDVIESSTNKRFKSDVIESNKLDKLFKSADKITPKDDLEFEVGKLRTKLETKIHHVEHDGQLFLIEVDPLNDKVRILDEQPTNS